MHLSFNKLFWASSTTLRYAFISQESSTVGALVHTAAVLCFIWPKAVMSSNSGACWCCGKKNYKKKKKSEECSVLLCKGKKGSALMDVLPSLKKIEVK